MTGMGYGGYEEMERRDRMDSGTTSENTTFKPISVTAAEAWVREVGLEKMPVPSVSLEDVKRAFIEGYELANAVREKESLLLQAELRETRDSINERLMEWRGLEAERVCRKCGGSGKVAYGSTATWRGGIGGQAITVDVCDRCWGSGDSAKVWPSWRKA